MQTDEVLQVRAGSGCHCFHCGRDGFKRSDLTSNSHKSGAFLCPDCRDQPGVEGQKLARFAGLRGGSPEYWARTRGQLNIVSDDEEVPQKPKASRKPRARESAAATEPLALFRQWRADVFADADLEPEAKLYLLALAYHADHTTGANCFPSRETIAETLGWSGEKVRWQERKAKSAGWVAAHPLRSGWRRSTMLYQFCNPHTGWQGPIVCRARGRSLVGVPRGDDPDLDCGDAGPEHQP